MNHKLIIILAIMVSSAITYYAITTFAINKPIVTNIHDILTNLEGYEGKDVIVSGVITKIINGKTIYMLWDNNESVILNLPDELRNVEINRSVEIDGVVIIKDNMAYINVKKVEYL